MRLRNSGRYLKRRPYRVYRCVTMAIARYLIAVGFLPANMKMTPSDWRHNDSPST